MKIVEPKVEIITEQNPLKRIEIAGRTCWQSEGKITEDSAMPFVQRLIARGHMTPLEHARIEIPIDHWQELNTNLSETIYGFDNRIVLTYEDMFLMNVRDYIAIGGDIQRVADGEFQMADDYMTVRFICDRAIANELVRHRIFSFCQESTRYCNYSGEIQFILPVPFEGYNDQTVKAQIWQNACVLAQDTYKGLISVGCSPQEARNVLPLSLKTELVMTGILGDWDTLIKMRSDKAAHPQMQYLMKLLKEEKEKTNV